MLSKLPPEIFLIFAALFWGGTFVAIKLALESVSPFLFISIRFWLAGLAILLLYRKVLFRKENFRLSYVGPAFLVALSAFIGYSFQTIGLVTTTATQSGFITGTYVIFVPMLQILIERKFPSLRTWAAVCIVFVGLFFISQNGKEIDRIFEGITVSLGDLLTLVCAFFFAIYIILIDIYSRKIPVPILVSFEILFIALFATFVLPMEQNLSFNLRHLSPDYKFWIGVIYTAFFATILTSQIQTRFQKSVSAARAGVLYSLEPVFSFFLAYLVLGESLSVVGGIGCAIVLFGILLSELR
jgi:drug/metabolite transporter (DMT)-like permease